MTFKTLEDIEVWKQSYSLSLEIYKITLQDSFGRDWSLRDQIRGSAVSIPSNIAEGFERNSNGDFRRFVLIAKGSCGELRTQLQLARDIGYIAPVQADSLLEECSQLSSKLASLAKYLNIQR